MSSLTRAAVSAVASGRFVTTWSVAVSLPLSLTVMAPVGGGIDPLRALPALVATWLCFATGLTGIAVIERAAHTARARAAIVIVGILLCGSLRPVIQDAWFAGFGLPTPPPDQLPFRVATNVVVWAVVLGVIAVLEGALRSLRRTNALLRSVVTALSQAQEHARVFAREAQRLLADAGSAIGAALDDLQATPADVRRLSEEHLRAWSHRFAALAEEDRGGAEYEQRDLLLRGETPRQAPAPRRPPFRLPPPGIVAVLYAACLLPYAARTQEPFDLIAGLVVLVLGSVLVDVIPRRRRITRTARGAALLFVLLSAALGLALSALAVAQGVAPLIAIVSAIAYIGYALAAASCAGALHRLRREQQRLTSAVAAAQRATRAGTRPTREGLRGTAELLHRDGQGACVVFALAHPNPTPSEIRGLRDDLTAVVDRMPCVFADANDPRSQVSLTGLFDTWAHVIELVVDIDDDSRATVQAVPWVARDCYDVIAEGLLNTVKHASERRAHVSLQRVATGGGPQLRVRVSSAGAASPGARLRSSSRAHELGARLLTRSDGVVLEASFPLAADPAVVSPEHRA